MMMKILSLVFGAFLLGSIQAQTLEDYPNVTEAYELKTLQEMLDQGRVDELEKLEFFANQGWSIAPAKEGNDYPELQLIEGMVFDATNFNPLQHNLKAAEGAHQYYNLPSGEVLIVFSEERLNVLFARYKKLKGKN